VWRMILYPNSGREPAALGVGASQGRIKNSFTFRRIRELLTLVRRADAPPLDANRSSASKLDRRNGARAIKRLRLIHIMCPFWKAFYKAARRRGKMLEVPHFAHGFVRQRRREAAFLVQSCATWRARRCGVSHVIIFHDMTNAFPCSRYDDLDDCTKEHVRPEDYELFLHRRHSAAVTIETADSVLTVKPESGGMMGEPNAPEDFIAAFHPRVQDWQVGLVRRDLSASEKFFAVCPFTGERLDTSITTFADDVAKKHYVTGGANAVQTLREANAIFDRQLERGGYGQNRGKQEVVPSFSGANSHRNIREFLASGEVEGKVLLRARYLGPRFSGTSSNVAERKTRVRAARSGWMSMGSFWHSGAPKRTLRLLFISKVQSQMCSAGEAMVFRDVDYKIMNTVLLKLLRSMMKGRACREGAEHREAMSGREVYTFWKLVPVEIELRVKRLRWLQTVLADQRHHMQLIAAIFGKYEFEDFTTVGRDGRLDERANPWAKLWMSDVMSLQGLDEGDSLLEAMGGDIRRLFQDDDCRDMFMNIDMRQIRARYWARSVPPQGQHQVSSESSLEEEPVAFTCTEKEGGVECGAGFMTFRALRTHMRFHHGTRCILYSLTVTNQCPWCMSTFANRLTAQHHVDTAFRNARCLVDHSPYGHEVIPPDSLECPECEVEHETLAELQVHIRTHAPLEAPSLVFSVTPPEQRQPEGHGVEAGRIPDWLVRRRARLAAQEEGQGRRNAFPGIDSSTRSA